MDTSHIFGTLVQFKNMKEGLLPTQDRRIKARHKAPCLQVTARGKGVVGWLRGSVEVQCIDINRYGMAIESTIAFRLKEKVQLDFKGKYITQSDIEGQISSIVRQGNRYRIGITFSYFACSKNYSREIDNALSRIEHLYHQRYN